MNELDDKIRDALRGDPTTGNGDDDREETIREMVTASFRGRTRWINLAGVGKIIFFLAVSVFAAFRFFAADTPRDQLLYASLFLAGAVCVMSLAVATWSAVQGTALMREIKRLELQVAELSGRLDEKGA